MASLVQCDTKIPSLMFPQKKDTSEEKAKIVAAVWGTELIQILHAMLLIVLVQSSQRGKELNQFCPPSSSDDLCLLFCIYPSYFHRQNVSSTVLFTGTFFGETFCLSVLVVRGDVYFVGVYWECIFFILNVQVFVLLGFSIQLINCNNENWVWTRTLIK